LRSRRETFLKFVNDPLNVKHILVIRNGLVGDTVFVTPVLKRLRDNFPNAKLDFAASARSATLLKNYPYADAIYPLPSSFSAFGHSKFFLRLRRFHYDIVIVQEANSHYALMGKLAGGRFLVGFKNSLDYLMDFSVPWPNGEHAVFAELETVHDWTTSTSPTATELPVTDEELAEARNFLQANRVANLDAVVCIHPGCNSKNSEKEWVDSHYAELADLLIEKEKVEVIFEGTEAERELIERIIARMKFPSISLAGKTNLRQVLGVLKISKIVIGSDTGTLHLANAVGTPTLMLFGRTDPIDTGPFDPSGRSRFARVDLSCIGCVHRVPVPSQWDTCKSMRPVLCMKKLSPQVVYQGAIEILNLNREAR
jgi:lipopolysaccharide heptosyltransferase II